MKRFVVVLLLLPLLSMAQSEESRPRNFSLGFTASPTFGWLNFSEGQTGKSDGLRTGFSYGVLGDFSFSDNYYFSTAFTVTTINANTKEGSTPATYKLQYLDVPFTLKLKSNFQQERRFYGQFGLSTGIKIGAKQEGGLLIGPNNNADIATDINIFRLGLVVGGGAEWNLNRNMNLMTGLSFNNGFTDVFDTADKAKNSYISLNLGIFF